MASTAAATAPATVEEAPMDESQHVSASLNHPQPAPTATAIDNNNDQQQQQPSEEAIRAALAEFNRRGLTAAPAQNHPLAQAPPQPPAVENEALRVRHNLFRASLSAVANMNSIRRTLLVLRLFLSIAQVAVGITIASLPSSHHDSIASDNSICQPSAMLVFLSLHIVRVAINLPADLYLSMSPHRSNRARRPGAVGLEAREQTRTIGNIFLDRRIARFSDFLAFGHVVLFIVGNYTLYSSSECATSPARSVPLFWTVFSFLAIDYLSIIEIAILALAVIFFLPVVVFLLRLFGIADRLPQPDIQPEHKKISQETVDQIPLVFYRPAEEGEEGTKEKSDVDEAAAVPLPPSRAETPQPKSPISPSRTLRRDQSTASTLRSQRSVTSVHSAASSPGPNASSITGAVHRQGPLSRLLFARHSSRRGHPTSPSESTRKAEATDSESISLHPLGPTKSDHQDDVIQPIPGTSTSAGYGRTHPLPHPLHPLPAHRATCPICLCDFEEPPDMEPAKWEALERRRVREARAKEDGEDGAKAAGGKMEGREEVDEAQRVEGVTPPLPSSSSSPPPTSSSRSRIFHRVSRNRHTTQSAHICLAPENPSSPVSQEPTPESDALLLTDVDPASEALEPLRLMDCGHVLHRSCLDEWLTGVSGRCPVCSRPVLKPAEGEEEEGEGEEDGTRRGEV
ncbi:hypothetical protein A4X13_0g6979, partial [Tilletia indica]